ncbi:unnamed protein product [Ilex paraguariensis]|uniref:Glycosyltransferase n=1 Tax=Ilex paraguariensis TaxID=185542 RepID=A0ABC8QM24_9AQUA
MQNAELVFIPSPIVGHLISTVEIAKLLLDRDHRLSITVLIMKLPIDSGVNGYINSLSATATPRLRFVDLHLPQGDSASQPQVPSSKSKSTNTFFTNFVDSHKAPVRDVVAELTRSDSSSRLAGFIVDMFCTAMIDVANEFGVPTYAFFTSGAAFLGLMLHLQSLSDDHHQDITELNNTETELRIPSFTNPVPARVLPSVVVDKAGGSTMLLTHARRLRNTKGIMVNTFMELESNAVESVLNGDKTPPIFPVGPILNLSDGGDDIRTKQSKPIMEWLDHQPPSSVVFLCFGSMGCFEEDQVKEIAQALENSRHRFLWSLRRPPPKEKIQFPSDYENPGEVLPEGFLERTAEVGRVIGWAPQVAVLSHPATGGFVSHCGWNSTLESVWCGVPMATWPLYAEQQMNAFEMVTELELAVEIKMDYFSSLHGDEDKKPEILSADLIEGGINRLMMGGESEISKKVREMREKSRVAVAEGGSSYNTIGRLIEEVMNSIA